MTGLRAAPRAGGVRTGRKSRFSRTQVALVAGIVAMFALGGGAGRGGGVTGGSIGSEPRSTLAVPPPSDDHVTTTAAPSARRGPRDHDVDDADYDDRHVGQLGARRGRVGNGCAGLRRSLGALRRGEYARGDDQDGELVGDRVRDVAGELLLPRRAVEGRCAAGAANAVPAGGGFDAVNPADGSRYQVRPDKLTISSSRGS